jgi:hypothetical protein
MIAEIGKVTGTGLAAFLRWRFAQTYSTSPPLPPTHTISIHPFTTCTYECAEDSRRSRLHHIRSALDAPGGARPYHSCSREMSFVQLKSYELIRTDLVNHRTERLSHERFK